MENIKQLEKKYFELLGERRQKSRIYRPYQLTGLIIAKLLEDPKHRSLYIKLAKEGNPERLLELAEKVAEKENIENKGAYFMKLLHDSHRSQ